MTTIMTGKVLRKCFAFYGKCLGKVSRKRQESERKYAESTTTISRKVKKVCVYRTHFHFPHFPLSEKPAAASADLVALGLRKPA